MRSCDRMENGKRCNEPSIVEGCCYDHAHTCKCGQPMHFTSDLCSSCETERLIAAAYQRGREDVLKENITRLESTLSVLVEYNELSLVTY